MTEIIKYGKKIKRAVKGIIVPQMKPYVWYSRRIERIKTNRRICAMTFDDGPMQLPCEPDLFGGRALTDVILDELAAYGAKGTFDVIGSTEKNYPDKCGKIGTPMWGGIEYDHYPDFGKDLFAGALHCPDLIRRIISEGHQITNHSYSHILFGSKPLIYGRRKHLRSIEEVTQDIEKLHRLMLDEYGYEMKMSRPPHYVDNIEKQLTSYDAYALTGYQYLAASFDGCGWLPSAAQNSDEAIKEETEAMIAPLRTALEADPDSLCGQIIFQKDGYNMGKRTPVAFGLPEQLKLLAKYGYTVVTADELCEESPFRDVGRDDPDFEIFAELIKSRAIAYTDNTLRPDNIMTRGELAMLIASRKDAAYGRIRLVREGKKASPYSGAFAACLRDGVFPAKAKPDDPVCGEDLSDISGFFKYLPKTAGAHITRREILRSADPEKLAAGDK